MTQMMFKIALPDGSVREVPAGSTPADVALAIGPGLAKTAMSTVGGMMNDAHASMEKAAKASDERSANSKAEAGARSARYTSTRSTTDLSKY